jgi:hypothetical protein
MFDNPIPGPFSSIASDLISDIAKDQNFSSMVEREVQTQVHAQLQFWWKVASAVAFVIVSTLSFAGYREYAHFDAYVTEKEKDLNDRLNRLNQIANDAQQRGTELRGYVDQSRAVLASADRQATASRDESHMLLDEGKNQIRAMTEQLMSGYQSQGQVFLAANQAALAANQQATHDGRDLIKQGQTVLDSVTAQQRQFEETARETFSKLAEIQRDGEQLKRLATLETELKQAKTFAFVMLESNQSKPVALADPLMPGRTIRLKLSTGDLKDRFDLRIDADGTSEHQDEENLITGDTRSIRVLKDKNLSFEVVAVRHRKLAYDFVMLRIFFADAPAPTLVRNDRVATADQ